MENFFHQFKIFLALWDSIQKKDFGLQNKAVAKFEKSLAEYLGVKYVIAVASGTDALILSLKAFDLGPGDEVIVPSVSAFSTAAAVRWVNAIPVFVDVRAGDMNIDSALIEAALTKKTKAVIPVHLNGKMAEMEIIRSIADRNSLIVIEDAAQAIGSKYKDKPVGHYGEVACLSFNPHKILGTYDGGAVVTNNKEVAEKIFYIRTYGAHPKEIHRNHPLIGISSRLSPLHAAILSEKLPGLSALVSHSRANYFLYVKMLADIGDWTVSQSPSDEHFINGHRFFFLTQRRDELFPVLRKTYNRIRTDHTVPLPYFPVLNVKNYKRGDFPVAEKIANEAVFLPTHYPLNLKDVEKISKAVQTGCV